MLLQVWCVRGSSGPSLILGVFSRPPTAADDISPHHTDIPGWGSSLPSTRLLHTDQGDQPRIYSGISSVDLILAMISYL